MLMKVKPDVWLKAVEFRGFIASEFLKYHGPTDADAGLKLGKISRDYGYREIDSPILGKTLRSWMNGSVPLWAAKSMVHYILTSGFIPDGDHEMDMIMAHVLAGIENGSVEGVIKMDVFKNIPENELKDSLIRVIK